MDTALQLGAETLTHGAHLYDEQPIMTQIVGMRPQRIISLTYSAKLRMKDLLYNANVRLNCGFASDEVISRGGE
jgi:hypothetical protein